MLEICVMRTKFDGEIVYINTNEGDRKVHTLLLLVKRERESERESEGERERERKSKRKRQREWCS